MTTISIEIPDVLAAQLAEVAKSRCLALNDFMLLAATEKWARYEEEDIERQAVDDSTEKMAGMSNVGQ